MTRFLLGVVAGVAAAWAALAIWQRLPEFPDLDADAPPLNELSPAWRRGR